MQAYNRKQGTASSDGQQANTGEDDEADSDSTSSGSSANLVGKTDGAGGKVSGNANKQSAAANGDNATSNGSTGAFDTSAIKSKLSKRPPGGKVRTQFSTMSQLRADLHIIFLLPEQSLLQLSLLLQMSKKALMERAKEDRKKSDSGEKSKSKPKVSAKFYNVDHHAGKYNTVCS